jgi:hypothetical protein
MTPDEHARNIGEVAANCSDIQAAVEKCVERHVKSCPYSYYFNRVTWKFNRGALTLEGSVASFYLKQVLQVMLRDVEHVERIENQVDVVSSAGLSSVCDKGQSPTVFDDQK